MDAKDVYHCGRAAGLHQRRGKCAGGVGPARVADHSALRSDDQLRAWRQSDQHRRLLLEAESLVENNGTPGLLEEEASEAHEDVTVTECYDLRQA